MHVALSHARMKTMPMPRSSSRHPLTTQVLFCPMRQGFSSHWLLSPTPPQDAKRADFPLPTLGPKLAALQHEASFGRGFVVLKGVPVERYSRKASVIAFWLIGQHWGLVSGGHTAVLLRDRIVSQVMPVVPKVNSKLFHE